MPIHVAAGTYHHVEPTGHTGERSATGRIATPRNREAADLGAGDLRLRSVTAASCVRHGVLAMMFRCGVCRGRNDENGEREPESFHKEPHSELA